MALTAPVAADLSAQAARPGSKAGVSRTDTYQVPAGTPLILEFRTDLDSASSVVNEPIEATLQSPIIQDGVELVPTGSVVFGTVTAIVPPSAANPRATLTCEFAVIEHLETGSRATITTRPLIFHAPEPSPVPARRRFFASKKRERIDVAVRAGQPAVAVLAGPFLVRIPK